MNGGTHKKWHQGVVSRAYRSRAGEMSYNGEATMAGSRRSFQAPCSPASILTTSLPSSPRALFSSHLLFTPPLQDTPLVELRVAPNVMDCLAE